MGAAGIGRDLLVLSVGDLCGWIVITSLNPKANPVGQTYARSASRRTVDASDTTCTPSRPEVPATILLDCWA